MSKIIKNTFAEWWTCLKGSIIIKSYKTVGRVTERRDDGMFILKGSSGERQVKRIQQ